MTASVYLHIPFCQHRCGYCDFNTYAGQENAIPEYIAALKKEIQMAGEKVPVHTIFFGGGTPSLIPPALMGGILVTIATVFDLQPDAEITLEANPGTVSPESLRQLRAAGFNRISYGMQSAHPDDLRLLERQHDHLDVIHAVEWARIAGFDNLSLDLIFALPFQTLERWKWSLEQALLLKPDHLSLYGLTIEHGTPFRRHLERGLIPLPDDDLGADMYEWAGQRLNEAGFAQYEISNWAKQTPAGPLMARHNLQYWRNLPYYGFGAGAHGYIHGTRTANVNGIRAYIQRIETGTGQFPAAVSITTVDRWTAMEEHMMVGLRLTEEGVSDELFTKRFGVSLEQAFAEPLKRLAPTGLLEWVDQGGERRLRLSKRGQLVGNQVFQMFVGNPAPAWLTPSGQ